MKSLTQRTVFACVLALGLLTAARPASAQGFISPLIGYNFGGDAGCLTAINCEDKNLNLGVSFGALGKIFGIEEEIAYAKDFFGESPTASSNVLTAMTSLMLAPDLKVVRPYGLVGIGLIKSHAELTTASLLDTDSNVFGWDVGGGLMVFITQNFGLRGDIRYFHAFPDFSLAGIALSGAKLDYGRAAAGVVFKF